MGAAGLSECAVKLERSQCPSQDTLLAWGEYSRIIMGFPRQNALIKCLKIVESIEQA